MKLISSLTHYFQFLFSIQSSNQVVISCIYWIKRKNLGAESVRGRHRDDYMWFNICNSDVRGAQIFTHFIEFLISRASLQKSLQNFRVHWPISVRQDVYWVDVVFVSNLGSRLLTVLIMLMCARVAENEMSWIPIVNGFFTPKYDRLKANCRS